MYHIKNLNCTRPLHEWRVPQVHPRVLSEIQILTMTPMNVGKAKASQVAAIAGRKDAAGALIISDDVALVPRGSLPSGSVSRRKTRTPGRLAAFYVQDQGIVWLT